VTSALPPARADAPQTSNAVVARAETDKVEPAKPDTARPDAARTELLPQPAGHGTGNGLLGVLPASSLSPSSASQAMAYADPAPQPQPAQNDAVKPAAVHTGWIIQVGALESESEALQRIDAARSQSHGLLAKADPFTEPVLAKGDRKLFRARFAGLDRDQAEAACRTLKRSDISCITVRN
jgi:D-alanyl-D-alanine carboxypeptidase